MTDTLAPAAARAAPAPGAAPRFKPYVLWRRGTLSAAALAPLVPAGTWALLDRAAREEVERRALGERLADQLYPLVPALDPDTRRRVLQLRRDLHNDRNPPDAAVEAAAALLDDGGREALLRWRESRLDAARLEAEAEARLADELRRARLGLAGVATGELYLRGVQLSGPHLYRSVRDYATAIRQGQGAPPAARHRKVEGTVVRYACRMALRTSPFGCFTEIGAQPWRAPLRDDAESPAERRHLVRLNRGLLTWMVHELRRVDEAGEVLRLRLNHTLHPAAGGLEAFTRGMDGSEHAYWGERFVSAKAIGPVGVVVSALADGPLPRGEVVAALAARGVPADRAAAFVNGLVDAGICHLDLGVPDQTPDLAAEAERRLRASTNPRAAACADSFRALQRIEDEFGDAPVERREALLRQMETEVDRFAETCGVPSPLEMTRSLVFEDLAAAGPPRGWRPAVLERNRDGFAHLQRLIPVLDDTTYEQIGLHHWFTSRFGPAGRCDDLLALYRAFSELSQGEMSEVMQGVHSPRAAELRGVQRGLLEALDGAVAGSGGAAVLRLDEVEAAPELPAWLAPWSEASYRVQLVNARDGEGPLVVVNEVTTGHGVFFSRFCDLVEPSRPGGWSLGEALRESLAAARPLQADLTAVLGLNINLHPRLTPLELVYPGSVATGPGGVLSLRDLAVEADPGSHALRLVERTTGEPVVLAPMNFLFPAAAPMLYRFLCMLSPLHGYRAGLWDRLRAFNRGRHAHLPRLVLGDLVLERRRWYLPLADTRELGDGSGPDTLASLRAAETWRERHGLPRESFFRVHERAPADDAPRSWVDETRRWALNARSARRKGQYLDFRNPFLVRLLAQQAATAPDGTVGFQECLPPPAFHDAAGGAEEFLVEIACNPASGEED